MNVNNIRDSAVSSCELYTIQSSRFKNCELKKQNGELKKQNGELKKRIDFLEKENAELKKQMSIFEKHTLSLYGYNYS